MVVYWSLLIIILINGLFTYKHRKWFIFSSFFLIILVAGLRSYEVGTDMYVHYANNYETIASSTWQQVFSGHIGNANVWLKGGSGGYDPGWFVYCKLLGMISQDKQFFIFASSLVIYGAIAVYIYKYAEDIVLETVAFYTILTFFNHMAMTAQATAVAVVLLALPLLFNRKFIKFAIVVIVASTLHQTALFCLLFIPLYFLPVKKPFIIGYSCAMAFFVFALNPILNFLVNTLFTSFWQYMNGSKYGVGHALSGAYLTPMMVYLSCLLIAIFLIFIRKNDYSEETYRSVRSLKPGSRDIINVVQPNNNFLLYMTITAITCYLMVTRIFVVWRMGHYVFMFCFTLMCRALKNINNAKQRLIVKLIAYVLFITIFAYFAPREGFSAYGVLPYKFFWQ